MMRKLSLLLLLLLPLCSASPSDVLPYSPSSSSSFTTTSLVPSPAISLPYHSGSLLSSPPLLIHLIFYGSFSPSQTSIISDFLSSFLSSSPPSPSVSSWWRTLSAYKDSHGAPPSPSLIPGSQYSDNTASLGKSLKRADMAAIVRTAIASGKLPAQGRGGSSFYMVLTAEDVVVERFCMSSCGFHDSYDGGTKEVAYGWVGNPARQCPGQCAWPFAVPQYGPPGPPLVAPNGDVGIDGMIISLGSVLAGAATNPFGDGYFQGDPTAPLEAATACAGIYGQGAYPGFPGNLLLDSATKASFNVRGNRGREFLLPALWSPVTQKCTPP